MSNSLQDVVDAFDRLRQPHLFLWWDKWIPDVSWATYLSGKEGGLSQSITHDEFNYAMKRIEPYKTILFSERNDLGIYCHQKKVNNRKVSFYYVSHDETIVPIRSNDIDDWKDFLKNNRISHNTRKRASVAGEEAGNPSCDPPRAPAPRLVTFVNAAASAPPGE